MSVSCQSTAGGKDGAACLGSECRCDSASAKSPVGDAIRSWGGMSVELEKEHHFFPEGSKEGLFLRSFPVGTSVSGGVGVTEVFRGPWGES